MRPGLSRALAAAYRVTARAPGAEEPVEVRPGLTVPRFVLDWSRAAPEEARRLVDRLARGVDLRGRRVLAVGRGAGDLGIELARRHAGRVVAVDMAPRLMALAQERLDGQASGLPVEMIRYSGSLAGLDDARFDVALAVDAFRRYGAERHSRHVEELARQLAACLSRGGLLGVRFGPPWKAPYGGGVDSRLPWAHLVFPERVVFDEFRRVRPASAARSFEDVGVNRVTLRRFRQAMHATGLECLRFDTNVTGRRGVGALRAIAGAPGLDEYLTQNVYGLWRRPRQSRASDVPGPR
jgi:SAM-dependent methyltransferase